MAPSGDWTLILARLLSAGGDGDGQSKSGERDGEAVHGDEGSGGGGAVRRGRRLGSGGKTSQTPERQPSGKAERGALS